MTLHMTPDDPEHRGDSAGDEPARVLPRRQRARVSLTERLERPAPTVWLSGQEAAEYVGVSWPTLRKILLDHKIPCLRPGTCWRIDVAVLDEHLHRIAEAS